MTDPLILGFDTSGPYCAVALLRGDHLLADRFEAMAKGQAERLMPLIEQVFAEAGLAPRDLDAIGVGVGPGNFTGIRIAVSAARGLALALGIPAIGVTAFDMHRTVSVPKGRLLVCLPAPRDQVYVQAFVNDLPEGPPHLLDAAHPDLRNEDRDAMAVGPGADRLAGHVVFPRIRADLETPPHVRLCRLASTRLAERGTIPRPAPLYVRPADAAPSKETGPVMLP